jgi:hypothetical protein
MSLMHAEDMTHDDGISALMEPASSYLSLMC